MDEMSKKYKEMQDELKEMNVKCVNAVKEKNLSDSLKVSTEYEYEQYKIRSKAKEKELIDALDEVRGNNSQNLTKKLLDYQNQLVVLEKVRFFVMNYCEYFLTDWILLFL